MTSGFKRYAYAAIRASAPRRVAVRTNLIHVVSDNLDLVHRSCTADEGKCVYSVDSGDERIGLRIAAEGRDCGRLNRYRVTT